jgi:hypothetical protein
MPRQLAQSLVQLDHDAERVVERGRQAWRSLRNDETFEKWIAIGRAIEIGRNEMMRLLHSNRPAGAQWSRVFGAWLSENGFDEIDKGVRSRLQNCLDNLPAIEMWRQNIGLGQRLQLNHPNTVWRKWQAAKEMPQRADRSTSPPPNRKDLEIVRLQEELDAANKKLCEYERQHGNVTEGRDWTWHDTSDAIAAAMIAAYPDKAKRVGSALQNLSKSTTKKPRAAK